MHHSSLLFILLSSLLAASAFSHEYDSSLELSPRTSEGGQFVSETENDRRDLNLIAPSTHSIVKTGETLHGRFGQHEFSFTHNSSINIELSDGSLSYAAATDFSLAGDVGSAGGRDRAPSVEMDHRGTFQDEIVFVTNDPELFNQSAKILIAVDVSGSLNVELGTGDHTRAAGVAELKFDDTEYFIRNSRVLGNPEIESNVDESGTVGETIFIESFGVLRPFSYLQEEGMRYDRVRIDADLEVSAELTGPSGSAVSSSLDLKFRNMRVAQIVLISGVKEVDPNSLTSLSKSGYDWIGTGAPVEPPDEFRWTNGNGGSFNTDSNWSGGNVPGVQDPALIDVDGVYAIDVGTQEVESLLVGGSPAINVEFVNANLRANRTGLTPAGIDVDQGKLTLSSGSISAIHSAVGRHAESQVDIRGVTSHWSSSGRFTIGFGPQTTVALSEGGKLAAAETLIGDGSHIGIAPATLKVSGFGSVAELGNAEIGKGNYGSLIIENGSSATAGTIRMATTETGSGELMVKGRNEDLSERSLLDVANLEIGFGGELAQAHIENSGKVASAITIIGQLSDGLVNVEGQHSELHVGLALHVGGFHSVAGDQRESSPTAQGQLLIGDGGKVAADGSTTGIALGASVGHVASGLIIVEGGNDQSPSSFSVEGGLRVGVKGGRPLQFENPDEPYADGWFRVALGAQATVDEVTVAGEDGSTGLIEVAGEDAGRNRVSELKISGDMAIGGHTFYPPNESNGEGTVSVEDGGRIEMGLGTLTLGNSQKGFLQVVGSRPSNPDSGSHVSAGLVRVGYQKPGEILVASRGELSVSTIALGISSGLFDNEEPTGSLFVEDGGIVRTGFLLLNSGIEQDASGLVVVKGEQESNRSTVEAETIVVGPNSEFQVQDKGKVDVKNLTIEGGGAVFVDGGTPDKRSHITVTEELTMGGQFGSPSFLGVDENAVVEVQGNFSYTTGASLCIDGQLISDQIFAAGFFRLGCSLGTATITGDFVLGSTGVLEIEIAGTRPVLEHDTMIVSGDVDLRGTVRFVFTDYLPKQGERFMFLDTAGNFTDSDFKIEFIGLQDGFKAHHEIVDGNFTLVADNDAVALTASDPISAFPPSISPQGQIVWELFGVSGVYYLLESSTDLETWETLHRVAGTNHLIVFSESDYSSSQRYFRIRQSAE